MNKSVTDQAVKDAEKGKKRKTRGKRPVYFYGLPAGVEVEKLKMSGETWSRKEAEAKLREKLGDDCQIIGPNYNVESVKVKKDTSITVKMDLQNMRFSGNDFTGHHAGWQFFAIGVAACDVSGESFDDDDLLQIQFTEPVGEKVPKPRIGGQNLVRRSVLDSVEER